MGCGRRTTAIKNVHLETFNFLCVWRTNLFYVRTCVGMRGRIIEIATFARLRCAPQPLSIDEDRKDDAGSQTIISYSRREISSSLIKLHSFSLDPCHTLPPL